MGLIYKLSAKNFHFNLKKLHIYRHLLIIDQCLKPNTIVYE